MGNKTPKLFTVIGLFLGFTVLLAAEPLVHELAKGETLYSLARRYGVSLDDLLRENRIDDPAGLQVGTRLQIPGTDKTGDTNTLVSVSSSASTGQYEVSRGDTYYSIARSHDMSVESLLEMNGRDSSRILRIGETLVVKTRTEVQNPAIRSTTPVKTERVDRVPWWPVAGLKSPLEGKLVGVSIETEPSGYVYAVASGTVVWTGPYRGFGHVVLVDSDGYIYLYGGNADLFVNVGQSISAGSRIGRLDDGGPQGAMQRMIFSVFRDGVPISPDKAPRG